MIHSQSITYPYKDVNHGVEKGRNQRIKRYRRVWGSYLSYDLHTLATG
ncbi:MAG: hypothetical protein WBC45_03045 [Atribacterota bacterium]|jgi:hypothetical protein